MPEISFFAEDIRFILKDKTKVRQWIKDTIAAEGYTLDELTYVFLLGRLPAKNESAIPGS